jgi:hypothetical protein
LLRDAVPRPRRIGAGSAVGCADCAGAVAEGAELSVISYQFKAERNTIYILCPCIGTENGILKTEKYAGYVFLLTTDHTLATGPERANASATASREIAGNRRIITNTSAIRGRIQMGLVRLMSRCSLKEW